MACQKVCKQGRDGHESKGQCIGKGPLMLGMETGEESCSCKSIRKTSQ